MEVPEQRVANPYVFIVGCPRSGTTLLQRMEFEVAIRGLLDDLGYPRAVPHPRCECLETTSRIRDRLAREPLTRYGWERTWNEREMSTHL